MIDFLRGIPVHFETDYIVLDVQGVGYRVFVSNPYVYQKSAESATVYIHYHVREDATLLYGFETREEQALFRKLLEVSGIGPRVALGMLSGSKPEAIVAAITQENLVYLTKLPGIGKKTAQRIVLDLKDKVAGLDFGNGTAQLDNSSLPPIQEDEGDTAWRETKEGLMALGYTEAEIEKVKRTVLSKLQPNDPVDKMMKAALQALYQG
jgi:Holliday junction DNA helicase RuvA